MGIYDQLSQLEEQAPAAAETQPATEKAVVPALTTQKLRATTTPRRHGVSPEARVDSTKDPMTSVLDDVDLVRWRDVLADTVTLSSTFRLTEEERRVVEDAVRDLRRTDRIKTSMNELARLGLMFLVHDLRRHGAKSVIHRVKRP